MVAYLGPSSLNPELSQFIVPKLIWTSSGTFQHHHQLSTSEDTASYPLDRLDTHQRANLCGQLEFVSRKSFITFPPTKLRYAPPLLGLVSSSRPSTVRASSLPYPCPSWKPSLPPGGSTSENLGKSCSILSRCQGCLRSPCRGWRRNPRRGQTAERAKGVWGRITSGWEQGPRGNDAQRGRG